MYRYVVFVLVLMFLAASAFGRIVMIDDFEHADSVAQLVVDEWTTFSEDEDAGIPVENVIGGVRYGLLETEEALFAGEVATVEVNFSSSSSGKCLINAFDPLNKLTRSRLRYGWASVSGYAFNDNWQDLTHIALDLDGTSTVSQDIIVRLWSAVDTGQEASPSVTKNLSTSISSLVFGLGEFTNQGLDLSDVDGIEVTFENIPAGQDLAIDQIRVVPEPAMLALLLIGGLAVFGRKR